MNRTVNLEQLLHAVKKAEKTKAKNGYGVLKNALFKFENKVLEVCTTDGNILNLTRVEMYEEVENEIKVMLDTTMLVKWLDNIYKSLPKAIKKDMRLEIELQENKTVFKAKGMELPIANEVGQFPKYEQLITNYNIDNDFIKQTRQDTFKIGLNRKYLKQILDSMTDDLVRFEIKDNLGAVYVYNQTNENEFALIMPFQMDNFTRQTWE